MLHTNAAKMASPNPALPLDTARLWNCLEDRISLRTVLGSGYQEAADLRSGPDV